MRLEIKNQVAPQETSAEFFLQKDLDGDIEVYVQIRDKSFGLGYFTLNREGKIKFNKYTLSISKLVSDYISLDRYSMEVQ